MADLCKAEGDAGCFFARDYLWVPDETKTSTWKLRFKATPGGKPDPGLIGNCMAALSPGGFRGNRVDVPASAIPGLKAKLRTLWKQANPDKDVKDMPEHMQTAEGYQPAPYTADPDETVECPDCGKMNSPDARYCDQCGAQLMGNPDVQSAAEPEPDEPEPDAEDEPEPPAAKPESGLPGAVFLSKLRELLKPFVSPDRYDQAVKQARGHAGGKARARARTAGEFDPLISDTGERFQLFVEADPQTFAAAPEWAPYFPKPGKYKHPVYGTIDLSKERIARFVKNINDKIYQEHIPLDAEHQSKLSGAVAWIQQARQNPDGSADVRVDWNDRGKKLLADDRYKYVSPEWYERWQDPATEEWHDDVAIGGAITTRPFFKGGSLRPLVATEAGLFAANTTDEPPASTGTLALFFSQFEPLPHREGGEGHGQGAAPSQSQDPTKGEPHVADEDTTQPKSDPTPGASLGMTEEQARKLTEMESELSALRQANEAQAQRIAAQELGARTKRFTDEVLGRSDANNQRWFGEVDKHVKLLNDLTEKFGEDSEQVKFYIDTQRAHAKQLREGDLFREIGRNGQALGGDAWSQMQQLAGEKQKSDPKLTQDAALALVMSEQPGLYEQYKQEQRDRAR